MPRVNIDMPDNYSFTTDVTIRNSDTNGGHLSNYAVLAIVDEARVRFLTSIGYTQENIIMTDSAIVYKAEGFCGDQLQIEVTAGDFNKYGCDIYYLLSNKATNITIAHAKTGIVFYDYSNEKMMLLPQGFADKFPSKNIQT